MTTYYPQVYILPSYNLPVVYPDWTTITVPTIYTPSVAVPQIYTTVCPCIGSVVTEPVATVCATCNYICTDVDCIGKNETETRDIEIYKHQNKDPIEQFISLPKELFPSARTQAINPNSIIDEFCLLPNINSAVNCILDLEFGLPRVPVTRSIAVYNLKSNNVLCKTSLKVHPGFDSCSDNFKQVILGYYRRIMCQWYKGYVIMNHDKSVENFQAWLVVPMNLFGLGWR